MYERLEKILGKEKTSKLNNTNVLLVGIGGVGGSSFEMLVRAGINNITIIDFDVFEDSNLNRQILSNINNINLLKVEEAKKRALLINKKCNITCINKKLDEDILKELNSNYDYIIDACDDMNAKVLLIKYAINNNIKIISSMGTGNKVHPELLEITNIWKTEYDPLAKVLRNRLKKENIKYKLPVVSSKERPIIKENGPVGSICTVPNAAGILLSSYVINDIIKEDE